MNPVWSSWPSLRHAAGEQAGQLQVQHADQQGLLTYEQLRTWMSALKSNEYGQLVISSDSLRLLPAQLPYELLGPLILAAVDSLIANKHQQCRHKTQQRSCAAVQLSLQDNFGLAAQGMKDDQQPHQQQQGLQLVGIDLQQPAAAPLTTCMAAYSCLQQLSLQELNIDVCAAKALGSILHSGSNSFSSKGCSTGAAGCSLRSLTLDTVFMCDMAWQALCKGLAAGCELQTLRLLHCLQPCSLPALAAALAGGCRQLVELDVSHNHLGCARADSSSADTHGSSSSSSREAVTDADTAWGSLVEALQGCTQLQALSAVSSSLGPKACSAVAKLLRGKECSLKQLNLSRCGKMGVGALNQVVAAAASCCSLEQLDLSSTGLNDAALKPYTQASGSSWLSRGTAAGCKGLKRLAVGGNCWLSGAAVGQLGMAMAAGGQLRGLMHLSLAGCASVGDEGAASLAAALAASRGSLHSLDMSGCELTDAAAAALAGLLAAAPAAEAPAAAAGGFRSPLKWCAAAAAAAAAVSAEARAQLQELRLADNQITPAGICVLAEAVGSPNCRLQLLDVSFNWVGPQGMQPLVEAAAAAAAPAAGTPEPAAADDIKLCVHKQQKLRVLTECLPEYWRVEAAKKTAMQTLATDAGGDVAAAAVHGSCQRSSSLAVDVTGLADSSTCSGSCCSQAGTAGNKALSAASNGIECIATGTEQSVVPDKQQLWMFNTLFCQEGGLSRTSSAIATGMYGGSDDICNHYDDSDDALSDIDSSSCSTAAASASSGSTAGAPALASTDGSNEARLGAEAAPWMLVATGSHVSCEKSCQVLTSTPAGFSTANDAAAVGAESSSGSMEDAPAAQPGQSKQLATPGLLQKTNTLRAGLCSPSKDQARVASAGGAAVPVLAAARPPAGAAVATKSLTKLVPRPPDRVRCMPGSSSSSSSDNRATLNWSGAPVAAATPALKNLRTTRQRVAEPAAVACPRTSAGRHSPARTTFSAAAAAAAAELPGHRLRNVTDAAEGGGSLRQLTAAASSSLAVGRSVTKRGVGGFVNRSGAASPAAGVSSDSCALRDCAPMPGRRSALARVSS
ncbi:hypothetical protein COO60DRAFT_1008119 [Scenedesmus sp. NREL 46B-D3]|nr:hypothetical protein COO60DRAFT_1008119 [Scenedesmus sp. NREL 46B-D3]